jgi:hypothetical protein
MNSSIKTIVLLSPGFRYMIPLDSKAIKSYTNRAILIIASKSDDEYRKSLSDSEELIKLATGRKELKVASAGHGVDISDSSLVDWVVSWLKENF